MWWVMSQIWLNSDSNELSQNSELSQVSKFGFELSRSWVRLANLAFELSRSWVTWIVIWVRVESVRTKMSRAQPCHLQPREAGFWPSQDLLQQNRFDGRRQRHSKAARVRQQKSDGHTIGLHSTSALFSEPQGRPSKPRAESAGVWVMAPAL